MKMSYCIILFLFSVCPSYGQDRIVLLDTLGADSIVQVFYRNGQLCYQIPYRNGKQNGWYEHYHENGFILGKSLMIDGQKADSFNREFNNDGTLYREGYIRNGNQVGKWYAYTNDGEPFKIYIFNRKGEWVRLKVWNWEKGKWEKSLLY